MKVLQIINSLGPGGAEKLLTDFVPLLNSSEDIKTDILLLTDKNNVFYDSLAGNGVKIDIVKYNDRYALRNIFGVRRHIINGGYQIVHAHLFPAQYWVALAKILLLGKSVRFITTEHSTHNRRRGKWYFRFIDKFMYAQYDCIISISEKTKENLVNWIDPKHKRLDKHIVIENGVDIAKIQAAAPYNKHELIDGVSEDTKLVCMVGRFSEQKDQATLISAFSALPENLHLLLVGEGQLLKKNKQLAHDLNIADRVHFLGFREDVPRILKTMDVVVLSSHWEGFGLAAVEGMAAGKPVLASDVGGLREVVGEAGLLFRNVQELADRINGLTKSKSYYEDKARACKQRAEKYSHITMTTLLRDLYFAAEERIRLSKGESNAG
ncbi:MAG: glycosyltransferase [Candidatus Pelethousia sp.]|nr:glycosyltransferase [Candidatus Pelethousia sp.]